MTFSITPLIGNRGAGAGNGVDLSTLPVAAKKTASRKLGFGTPKSSDAARIATGTTKVGLKPDEVKALTAAYLPVAEKHVDKTFAAYIKWAPKLQLKHLTSEQVKAASRGQDTDSVFAYVDSTAPSTINVAYQSPIFRTTNKLDAKDVKLLLLHEVLHTRSMAFIKSIDRTYGDPLANGKPASFSDGSLVVGLTEGLTEIFTMIALKATSTPSGYKRETKWAGRLIEKVGIEIAKKAYFGNDVLSMVRVEMAIEELIAADKKSPEISAARSN